MKSVMYAVNGDQTVAKPYGASEVYIVNGDTSVPKPAGVSEVYALNGDTSIEKPKGVSEIWLDGDDNANAPAGVSVVSIPNYSGSGPEPTPTPTPIGENTVRFKFDDTSFNPSSITSGTTGITLAWSAVSASDGLWDCVITPNQNGDWSLAFNAKLKLEDIGANNFVTVVGAKMGTGNTVAYGVFYGCDSLKEVLDYADTSSVTSFAEMFDGCTNLKKIPLLKTDSATNVNNMFDRCYNVETGILDMYNQLSTQASVPENHSSTFKDCGLGTVTGAAELAQIPSDWK